MGEARLGHRSLPGRRIAGPPELQQLEDEVAVREVDGGESDRQLHAEQRAAHPVRWLQRAFVAEPERLLVEPTRAVEVRDAETDVVHRDRSHRADATRRSSVHDRAVSWESPAGMTIPTACRCWPSMVSNCSATDSVSQPPSLFIQAICFGCRKRV